jgi:hypothetical protein
MAVFHSTVHMSRVEYLRLDLQLEAPNPCVNLARFFVGQLVVVLLENRQRQVPKLVAGQRSG